MPSSRTITLDLPSSIERPTMSLRFHEGLLEQAFQVERFEGAAMISASIEWRRVPAVDNDGNETTLPVGRRAR